MTFSSRPTRAKSLHPICRIGPGIRGRWRDRRAWCRQVGTPRTTSGAPSRFRTGFVKLNSRHMTAMDMQAWTAARMVGEATSRTNSDDPKTVFGFIKGKDFSIAAFKGQRLTLRDWNLQLRQPILLADGRMVVSVSPQEGFLHQILRT